MKIFTGPRGGKYILKGGTKKYLKGGDENVKELLNKLKLTKYQVQIFNIGGHTMQFLKDLNMTDCEEIGMKQNEANKLIKAIRTYNNHPNKTPNKSPNNHPNKPPNNHSNKSPNNHPNKSPNKSPNNHLNNPSNKLPNNHPNKPPNRQVSKPHNKPRKNQMHML